MRTILLVCLTRAHPCARASNGFVRAAGVHAVGTIYSSLGAGRFTRVAMPIIFRYGVASYVFTVFDDKPCGKNNCRHFIPSLYQAVMPDARGGALWCGAVLNPPAPHLLAAFCRARWYSTWGFLSLSFTGADTE